ncbi:MAG: hypothetical protein HY515_00455 [Candidatus Aenigmarchaeota archaeon]|nr:hypothetical protein [Candidatus Aenigmarchaeota archaeon]
MINDAAGKHPYSAPESQKVRIYSEAPVRIVLGGFKVTNAGYVGRLEEELGTRYRTVRKGGNSSNLPKSYRMPRCIVVQDTRNGHKDLAVINFGPGFTEIVNTGKEGSKECVEFLTETGSLLEGLRMSSGMPEDELKRVLRTEREKLFSE